MDLFDVIKIPVLHTERLVLRSYKESDLEPYYEMMADPDITRYLVPGIPMSPREAWRSIAGMAGHWVIRGHGQWAIEEKETGNFVGRCGIIEPEGWPGKELGWVLHPKAWAKAMLLKQQKQRLIMLLKKSDLRKLSVFGTTRLPFFPRRLNVYG